MYNVKLLIVLELFTIDTSSSLGALTRLKILCRLLASANQTGLFALLLVGQTVLAAVQLVVVIVVEAVVVAMDAEEPVREQDAPLVVDMMAFAEASSIAELVVGP